MFTGIVEATGRVIDKFTQGDSVRLVVESGIVASDAHIGDSISNNGCCLTVVAKEETRLSFDMLAETERCTNLKVAKPGSLINLERALRADARLGGHFVTGHVDATGSIKRWEESGKDWILEVGMPPEFGKFLVPKGCIAVDGMSLTVADVFSDSFTVWIIPHTRVVTGLSDRKRGDELNLEFDLLAKYTAKLIGPKNRESLD